MATRLGWIVEGLRTGVVTTPYPKRPDPTAIAGLHTRPVLRPGLCAAASGCDECVRACLPNAITIEGAEAASGSGSATSARMGTTLWLDLGRCIGCGLCAAVCPEGALAMDGEIELAAHEREALQQTAPLDPANGGRHPRK
jgi:formate hydrogenlyase subunit 6/NADH:ubiquinone oxidoreductase subunit I